MNKSPLTGPTVSRTSRGTRAPVHEILLRTRGPSGSSRSLQTRRHPLFPSVTCSGQVNFPLRGSTCNACCTMSGFHCPSSIAASAAARGHESSSRIQTASAPSANAWSIASSTPPALPRFSGIRRTTSLNGRSARFSNTSTVSSVEQLSATTTRSGGRDCRARASTHFLAVSARFIVAKTAAIFKEGGMGFGI